METVLEFAKVFDTYGPAVAIIAVLCGLNAYFIRKDSVREQNQQRQIDELHKAHNEVVLPLLADCREAIAASKEVINQNSQIITSWLNRKG